MVNRNEEHLNSTGLHVARSPHVRLGAKPCLRWDKSLIIQFGLHPYPSRQFFMMAT